MTHPVRSSTAVGHVLLTLRHICSDFTESTNFATPIKVITNEI